MPTKLSDPEIITLWAISSKIIDWINFVWQFYIAFSGIVVGWLFSGSRSLTLPQKYVVTLIFTLAYLMSLGVLIKTYMLLNRILVEFKTATTELESHTPKFKELFQKDPSWLYWGIGFLFHFVWYAICLFCVWKIVKTVEA